MFDTSITIHFYKGQGHDGKHPAVECEVIPCLTPSFIIYFCFRFLLVILIISMDVLPWQTD